MKPPAHTCSSFLLLQVAFGLCFTASALQAADWPQWRGPNRNGISEETGLLKEWPTEGPKLLWKQTSVGSGYSAPAVVGDRIFLLANEGLDNEFVAALAVQDGAKIWSTRLGPVGNPKQQQNFPGARSTPTVDGDFLYALSSDGDLACLEKASGTVRWRKSLRADFAGQPGAWAYSESPLIDGDTLVCTPGSAQATLVALNKATGDVLWKSALPEASEAAYASAVVTEAGGVRQYVQLLPKGLVGVEAKTGKLLWRYAKPVSPLNINIPTPIASESLIYVASAGKGAGAVQLKAKDGGIEAEPVYFNLNFPTAIGGAVKVGDSLFGTTGRALLCLDFAAGQIKWKDSAIAAASLCFADGRLYLHSEDGQVVLVEPSAESYREKGRFNPPDQPMPKNQTEKAWAYPVVANGRLFIRVHSSLWCYDITSNGRW